ncbi:MULTISPECIES: TetR/AcrR family transcriptional regulator [unclassified Herbaspirillum]|jgi:AcrR family transcriptional regulator|uniref:TetR/AcrR family transcriptional regulator n=1 Tax=unclassified Herbaspirillum TaxID=2624150 RepID=UPI000E2E8F98|nr:MULTISPECIES: TetR/AcrR family transcriptional regulator [unclassified Herbaspirillum]RFB67046.1 TetR/AcrR family transcriptional regulator [Herbaspirillum sp. 3R-3a1]TFI06084.1 TetR/AcrR family transcriptional regulator [Herbaspirillum sp. 3R11]TFI14304.1 TetR/AcrR family transcriptional regulator [Herbaspirillum sp. 3R-11]TFI30425.1 TetR/AcrR family transcriptional regulator [Herbaspirillum sp. 3C11]
MSIFGKLSFKDQAFKLRENAILDAATSVLGTKGYDLMTMDDVAGAVGISKPSLYKHFKSKEDLVGEALIRLIDGAVDYLAQLDAALSPKNKLAALLEWALRVRLDGGLPFLPSTSAHVRDMLMRNLKYVTRVLKLNGQIEKLVLAAQKSGELDAALPSDVILFSYYARTCDPAVEYLQRFSKMSNEDIVRHMLQVAFDGFHPAR